MHLKKHVMSNEVFAHTQHLSNSGKTALLTELKCLDVCHLGVCLSVALSAQVCAHSADDPEALALKLARVRVIKLLTTSTVLSMVNA